jgi:SAM-dependent MidA family methyltransferase
MSDRSADTPQSASVPGLPVPDAEALAHSRRLTERICHEITRGNGRIGFDRFMELVLYAPGLGYYAAGTRKFGEAGDFVTAPETSPLFARCLARQCQQVLEGMPSGRLLEIGAGSGVLGADLLAELETIGQLPEQYLILEVSPDLRQRQRQTLGARVPHLLDRIHWLDDLPYPGFTGLVIANEVLDAMPVHRFRYAREQVQEAFVTWRDGRFLQVWDPARSGGLDAAAAAVADSVGPLVEGYESEINLRAGPWLRALGERVRAGVLLLIDYGYPRREFYHPQRNRGTLMCHYRHRAHPDPFGWVGLQDITAHVDFTAVAEAGEAAGFRVLGYTTQAHFLIGCGLDRLLAESDPQDMASHLAVMQGAKRLTLPSEMGERFKVLALARAWERPLIGFAARDLRDRL